MARTSLSRGSLMDENDEENRDTLDSSEEEEEENESEYEKVCIDSMISIDFYNSK